ncbi:MAG: HD domain-containing protein [Syntrophaceae bacterium]|nr:HD domain-containing protein [Syntrophaceae bacterium]
MKTRHSEYSSIYKGMALIADPIYDYTVFTVPVSDDHSEKTEKDLIDSPWVQRLRRIYQLQSARWVYPSAEHTRFQHSLGTMHNAGEFGKSLYKSLKVVCKDTPTPAYVEELLRIAGLLHDVGHGPYGHFFDDHFLSQYGLTHEDISQYIIVNKLGTLIRGIKRGPSGPFAPGEVLDPRQVAFLIHVPTEEQGSWPEWLKLLRQLFTGIYTADNLDYVQRDAYMTGFALDLVDTKRLLHYTFYSPDGLTLHQTGISALNRFLNARLNLYTNVYFHRTTRALDLHLQEIFRETMNFILPGNPLQDMDRYLICDEWSLFHETQGWLKSEDGKRKRLGREWKKLFQREVKWKMSFSTEIPVDQVQRGTRFAPAADYEKQIRAFLPPALKKIRFRVDLATQDPRPLNPIAESEKRIHIYNPVTGKTSPEPLKEIYRFIPARVVHFRVFSVNHKDDEALSQAAEKSLTVLEDICKTNI